MSTPNSQPALLAAIEQATQDLRVQMAMTFGAQEEGGLFGPWGVTPGGPAVGDFGHSYGPYQINLPYHPGVTPQQATDPSYATGFMVNAYRKAVAAIPDSLWSSNPELATEEAAVAAERPATSYINSHGQAQVDQAYSRAVNLLGGAGGVSGGNGGPTVSSGVYSSTQTGQQAGGVAHAQTASLGSALGGSALDFLNPLAGIFHAGGLQDMIERGALIVLGALLMIIGLIMLVKDTSAGQQAVSGAKDAAAAGAMAAVAA